MSTLQSGLSTNLSAIAGMEQQLASRLTQTAHRVSRLEDLDEEQRAEVYAILHAIQSDTQVHHELALLMAGQAANTQGHPNHA